MADRVVSYEKLAELTDRCEAGLARAGVMPGACVGLTLPDSAEHLALILALARHGCCILQLNVNVVNTGLVILAEQVGMTHIVSSAAKPASRKVVEVSLASLLQDHGSIAEHTEKDDSATGRQNIDDAPFLVSQSSGTTGQPKRFIISQGQMVMRAKEAAACFSLEQQDVILQSPRLSFQTGITWALMSLSLGATLNMTSAETARELLDYLPGSDVTFASTVAGNLREMAHLLEGRTEALLPHLKLLFGGSALSRQDKALAKQVLTPSLYELYGTNEIGIIALERPAEKHRFAEAVGRLIDNAEAEVVDENGSVLPTGQTGAIRVRKPESRRPLRYLEQQPGVASDASDGWFYPGDVVVINEQDFVFLQGRVDDLINRWGIKFYPYEVEATLCRHADILDAAVVALPEEGAEPTLVALLVTRETFSSEAIRQHARTYLAAAKRPSAMFGVNEIPRNAIGKIIRAQLPDMARRSLETMKKPG
jgi:acyl-coenzyme A synthetase/AMP-(fatty) acid ligase